MILTLFRRLTLSALRETSAPSISFRQWMKRENRKSSEYVSWVLAQVSLQASNYFGRVLVDRVWCSIVF
ncbi:conserved protein of unknown function [Ectopseudomonas oleovorans]|uniref:Uncharacterized protein n=1 Tax=Ectopseudomonas oleovorans TaxID=301 RepID=A0A653B843_ECTOL|nr:conserved protein of unknown function [Pseudomonas oleovorans]